MQMASKERSRIYTQEKRDRYGWLTGESDQKTAKNDTGARSRRPVRQYTKESIIRAGSRVRDTYVGLGRGFLVSQKSGDIRAGDPDTGSVEKRISVM